MEARALLDALHVAERLEGRDAALLYVRRAA